MNFNGKFWHKPGHLGMTTDEVKKALKALPTPEAGDAGKAVVVNADADGYELGTAGGISISTRYTIDWNSDRSVYELLSVDSYASSDEAHTALDNTQSEAIITTLNGGLFDGTVVTLMPGVGSGHYTIFEMVNLIIVTIGMTITILDGRYYLSGDALITTIS